MPDGALDFKSLGAMMVNARVALPAHQPVAFDKVHVYE